MSKINSIQKAIKELEGGKFQKLFDAYLYKKFSFDNIQTLGVQEGTDKTTKGIPDSYIIKNNKYILIMYGSHLDSYSKIEKDILDCLDNNKINIPKEKIQKIICGHISTNIHIDQFENLKSVSNIEDIQLIGIDTLSHDLLINYPTLARDYLGIEVDTGQVLSINDFVAVYDKNKTCSPLDMKLLFREKEQEEIYSEIVNNTVVFITGQSGVGKTRVVLEVCRKLEQEGWNVFCIKSNNLALYQDIPSYLSDGIKYVLFIDDANQVTNLKYILEYVTEKKEVKEIKLIMTIRDYAKSKVKQITNDYFIEKEIKIKPLSNDEIKDILTENLGINNSDYLKTVAKIANGNPRLAVLAGEISKKKGYISLRNSTEIFSHYYGNIINNLDISTKQIEVLFIVALFVTIEINNTLSSKKIFDYFGINIAEFTKTCNELNELELVDVYADEVVKISDQSFSNYILKYVLFDKKMIMFSTLLNLLFPEIKAKLIYVINTMGELFFTDELEQYLTEEINKSWDKANSSIQNEYLETFYYFNLEKTLKIIYENIENENQNEFDLKCFDFNKSKNNQTIFNKNISILSGLKYTDYRCDAVEMIMIYFKKRPDLFMEFYTALTLKMGLDKHSSYYNFLFELEILDIIWKHTDNGNNYNESLLFIYVANKILDCCVNTTEQGDNKFNVNLITLRFRPNEEIKKLRKYIYEKLSILYFDKEYECIINNLLEGFHENGLDENDAKDFFEFDLQMIVDNFYKKIDVLSFRQAYILYKLDNHRKKLKIKDINLSSIYNLNKELNIYILLSKEYYKGNSYVENIEKRKTKIHEEIKKYTDNEYEFLFSACKVIQDAIGTTWELSKGLEYVFLLNEASVETYINILEKYFKYGSPLNCSCNKIISYLLNHISLEKICEILDKHHFSNKELWYKSIWECIPREGINNEVIELFKNRINNECEKDIPCLPHVVYFEKFIDNDKEILYHVTNVLINKNLPSYIIRDFLGNFIDEAEANTIINIYENNIHLLEKMYLIAATDNFDYEGRLLFLIVEKDKIFWEKYIDYISKEKHHREYEDSIFETMWSLDNYDSLVSIAFKKLVEENHFYSIGNLEAKQIFVNRKNNSLIIDRKKKWIKQYIVNNTQDISKIKRIFSAVDVAFPDIKKELLVFFIYKNNDFNCFEKIPLFPNGRSWTGSEIPSIDREIKFLVSLKNELNGVNFIKHRNYLKEEIQRLENYKKRVAINEYIENEDLI